jgi:hypothetical protein
MTIQDLGSIGEFVGGLLVVVSLFYLAMQIRQNTRSLRAAAHQEAVRGANGWSALLVQDLDRNRLLFEGCRDHSSLSPEELNQFTHLVMMFLRDYWLAHHLEDEGLIPPGIRVGYENGIRNMFRRRSMLRWLSDCEGILDSGTAARVRSLVSSLHV